MAYANSERRYRKDKRGRYSKKNVQQLIFVAGEWEKSQPRAIRRYRGFFIPFSPRRFAVPSSSPRNSKRRGTPAKKEPIEIALSFIVYERPPADRKLPTITATRSGTVLLKVDAKPRPVLTFLAHTTYVTTNINYQNRVSFARYDRLLQRASAARRLRNLS